jgi:hypothetical protein
VGFKEGIRTLHRIRAIQPAYETLSQSPNLEAILDATFKFKEQEVSYLDSYNMHPSFFVSKDKCGSYVHAGLKMHLWVLILTIIFGTASFLVFKSRTQLALITREIIESYSLSKFCVDFGITKVYDFIPYEIDSNILYFVLNRIGVQHSKFVSPGPLALHNKIMIADTLYLNTPYQFEELKVFKDTIQANEIKKIYLENAFQFLENYKKDNFQPKLREGKVGFYSHGSWVREESDHANDGLEIAKKEDDLLRFLTEVDVNHLVIFCHPKEKAKGMDYVRSHYLKYFDETKVEIAPFEKANNCLFDVVDIGVCVYSSIMFERLFAGFKTLIYSPDNQNPAEFPLKGSTIENICFKSKTDLKKLLTEATQVSKQAYFEKFKLYGYPFWQYES